METFATGDVYIFSPVSLFHLHVLNSMFSYEQTCSVLGNTCNSKNHQTEWGEEL